MSSTPLFSIVIPTYNRADLISETLDSVFAQSYKNYEVIVVDNCSTDNTVELLSPLVEEGRIQLIQNPENVERSCARNIGFAAAKGDYLTLLDSDDFMYPDNLKDAAQFVSEGKNTDFFHNYYELVDNSKEMLLQYNFPKENQQVENLATGNFISCIGVFLSKAVYHEFKFNEDPKVLGSEDWELWIRIRSSYPLGVIKKINSGFRHHSGRSISSYSLETVISRKNYIIDNLLKIDQVKKIFGQFENDMRSAAYIFAGISANEAFLFKEGRKFLFEAFKRKPSLLLKPRFIRASQISIFKIKKKFHIDESK